MIELRDNLLLAPARLASLLGVDWEKRLSRVLLLAALLSRVLLLALLSRVLLLALLSRVLPGTDARAGLATGSLSSSRGPPQSVARSSSWG